MALIRRAAELSRYPNMDSLLLALHACRAARDWYHQAGNAKAERYVLGQLAATLTNVGYVQRLAGQMDSALVYYRRARDLHRELGDRRGEAQVANNIGRVYQTRGRLDSAQVWFLDALQLARETQEPSAIATTFNNLGGLHRVRGSLDSAVAYYEQSLRFAVQANDTATAVAALHNLGQALERVGNHQNASVAYWRAVELARASGDENAESRVLASLGALEAELGNRDSALAYIRAGWSISAAIEDIEGMVGAEQAMASLHLQTGNADSAVAHSYRALTLARRTGNLDLQASSLNNLCVAYSALALADSAIASCRAALAIDRRTRHREAIAATLQNIAVAYENLGRSDSSLAYSSRALELFRALPNVDAWVTILGNMGGLHLRGGRLDSAAAYFRAALEAARARGLTHLEPEALSDLGVLFQKAGLEDSAAAYLHAALAAAKAENSTLYGAILNNLAIALYHRGQQDSAISYVRAFLETARVASSRYDVITALDNLAYLYQHERPEPRLDLAAAYYDSVAGLIGNARGRAGSDELRVTFAEQETDVYTSWTLAWLGRAKEVGDEDAALAGLATAERGRAQALLDLMRRTPGPRSEPGNPIVEARTLLASVVRPGGALLSYLATNDTLVVWLASSGRPVEVFRRVITRDSLNRLVARLRAGMGADAAAREARLSSDRVRRLEHTPREEPSRGVGSRPNKSGFREAAAALAALLVPPKMLDVVAQGSDVIIIPHSVLSLIPFAMLPLGDDGNLLGEHYALRYAPSLQTLADAQGRPGRTSSVKALVAASPIMPKVRAATGEWLTLNPLPRAEEEGIWVAKEFGVVPLVGGNATEAAVRRGLPDAAVVHLAAHGYAYASEAHARASFVALAAGNGSDGPLTVGDILDDETLNLSADLVVLSACQTGLGNLKEAEGTVGLQRAFLARGAHSVLVSLWSVSDTATFLLMKAFYQHWLKDEDHPSKAEALRRAQDSVRHIPRFKEPRYWAAFQLIGAN